jgi:hypothetical protein
MEPGGCVGLPIPDQPKVIPGSGSSSPGSGSARSAPSVA